MNGWMVGRDLRRNHVERIDFNGWYFQGIRHRFGCRYTDPQPRKGTGAGKQSDR